MSSFFRGHSELIDRTRVRGYLPIKKHPECRFNKVRMFALNGQNPLCPVRYKVVGHSRYSPMACLTRVRRLSENNKGENE